MKVKEEIQPVKSLYDLKDPLVRQELREFEKELAEMPKPYQFDWWLIKHGYIPRHQVRAYKGLDGVEYRKPEYNAVNQNIHIAWEKKKALESLQAMTKFAKAKEAESIELSAYIDESIIKESELPF